jgi:octaprenyl-diphosphate synthase
MQHGTLEQAALIRAAIEQGDIEKFAEVLQIVQQTGALDYTRQQALREVDDACQALKLLPASAATSSMLELAKLAVSRQF